MSHFTTVYTVSVYLMSDGRMLGHAGRNSTGKKLRGYIRVHWGVRNARQQIPSDALHLELYTACHLMLHHRIWVQKFKMNNTILILRERLEP